jgi:hypothetical protein
MASDSCEPHKQAEHMAALTSNATRRFFLPTRSRLYGTSPFARTADNLCSRMGSDRTRRRRTIYVAACVVSKGVVVANW